MIWVAGVSHSALQATQAAAPGGSKTVWDGVFSTAQAERGAAAYKTACSECHGNDLAGDGFAPALSGARVHGQLERPEVGDLFERIRISMPPSGPSGVTPRRRPTSSRT